MNSIQRVYLSSEEGELHGKPEGLLRDCLILIAFDLIGFTKSDKYCANMVEPKYLLI